MVWGNTVWMDGKLVNWNEARVSIGSGVVHYGLCVFEGIRAYTSASNELSIFRSEDHMNRLYDSARLYHMRIPFRKKEILEATVEAITNNRIGENLYIRPMVYRGEVPQLGVKQTFEAPVHVSIIVQDTQRRIGTESFKKGSRAVVSSWRRISSDSMPLKAKCSAHYANSALGMLDALNANVDYSVFLDSRGLVCEGTGQNVFLVKKNSLLTPPLGSSILEGITRDTIIKLALDIGYKVIEQDVSRDQLYLADEVFLCGTSCEIAPIVEIDKIPISDQAGNVTTRIAFHYADVVSGKILKYKEWLTRVGARGCSENGQKWS
jgi:branched-chain amino acid aminotransferase